MQIGHTTMTCTYAQHLVTAPERLAIGMFQHTTSRCCSLGIMKYKVTWRQAHSELAGLYAFMRKLLTAHWQAHISTDA